MTSHLVYALHDICCCFVFAVHTFLSNLHNASRVQVTAAAGVRADIGLNSAGALPRCGYASRCGCCQSSSPQSPGAAACCFSAGVCADSAIAECAACGTGAG